MRFLRFFLFIAAFAAAAGLSLATAFLAVDRLEDVTEIDIRRVLDVNGHTWAEVHLGERGWSPVEFHGIVIGAAAITDANVTDPALRARIETNTPRFLDYYFGHLDNQRLICANAVKRLPQCVVEQRDRPLWHRERWKPLAGLGHESELRVTCV